MIRRLLARLKSNAGGSKRTRTRVTLPAPHAPIYAIGDVHGCLELLIKAEHLILADCAGRSDATIVMLGDYIDRGSHSAAVLAHLIAPAPGGLRRVCLAGNHEDGMLRFLDDPESNAEWLAFGGDATLRSYGIEPMRSANRLSLEQTAAALRDVIPSSHMNFLTSLPVAAMTDGCVFVHAGIRPGIPLDEQTDQDLMWIREPFLSDGPQLPLVVVHGHTPAPEPSFGPGRIGIDTGAYMTGRLTVLKIEGGSYSLLT